jgi:hypothetical protein
MLLKMAVQNGSIKTTIDDTTTDKITGLNYGKKMYVDKTSLDEMSLDKRSLG